MLSWFGLLHVRIHHVNLGDIILRNAILLHVILRHVILGHIGLKCQVKCECSFRDRRFNGF